MPRRFIILITILITAFPGFAQLIANGDFEDWEVRDHYILNDWLASSRNVLRSENPSSGNYALRLENTKSNNRTSIVYNYSFANGIRGFPFSEKVLSMVFEAKYDMAIGDTARVRVNFRNEGGYSGLASVNITGSSNDQFLTFNVPITWYSIRVCDTVLIAIDSKIGSDTLDGDSYLEVDDLRFENIGVRYQDFPNQGFESWDNVGVEYPNKWNPVDLIVYDLYGVFLNNEGVTQTTDAHSGNYAVKISNYFHSNTNRYSYMYYGDTSSGWYPTLPVSERYPYLVGYYKHISDLNDSALVSITMYDSGVSIGGGSQYFVPNTEWSDFFLPINYYNSRTPDSAAVRFYSSRNDTIHDASTHLIIDDLAFSNFTLGKTRDYDETFKVYPNPTSRFIKISNIDQVDSWKIYGLDGKEISNAKMPKKDLLDLDALEDGVYNLVLMSQGLTRTKKIIIIK